MLTPQQKHELEEEIAADLAALGYPGLPPLRLPHQIITPAELLLKALSLSDLDSRLIEALPWLVWKFADLDWATIKIMAQHRGLQNRLGFIVNVARRLAEARSEREKASLLARVETALTHIRLVNEETLCHDSLTQAERQWLFAHRPPEAKHWSLLTDLSPESLHHVA